MYSPNFHENPFRFNFLSYSAKKQTGKHESKHYTRQPAVKVKIPIIALS